jgi:hypothetical protein
MKNFLLIRSLFLGTPFFVLCMEDSNSGEFISSDAENPQEGTDLVDIEMMHIPIKTILKNFEERPQIYESETQNSIKILFELPRNKKAIRPYKYERRKNISKYVKFNNSLSKK